jgi:transposase InsO family protein
LRSKLERVEPALANQREVNRILTARLGRVPPHKRPQYKPHERLSILEYRGVNALSLCEAAKLFLVTPDTISTWQVEIDSDTESSLFRFHEPVNRYPEFLTQVVQRLKALCPHLGTKKIAAFLTRAALQVSATTVGRRLREPMAPPPVEPDPVEPSDGVGRIVTADRPAHVWHVDLTSVPIDGTCNVGAIDDKALQGGWPFNWHVAVVEDHFSRACVGFAVFPKEPSSVQITDMLDGAIRERGGAPKYIISDRGKQFDCENYRNWCRDPTKTKRRERRKIRPRFGAVHRHGSIAVVERLIKSMKDECTRRIIVSYNQREFAEELDLYFTWYNEYRPHEWLDGRTPMEAYRQADRRTDRLHRISTTEPMALDLAFLEGRRHLPIVGLKKAG